MKVRPPFGASDRNVAVDLSRKRKADILDKKSNYSTPNFDGMPTPVRGSQTENSAYLLARMSDSQYDARAFPGRNVRGTTPGVVSNQNLNFAASYNEGSQFGKGQFYDRSRHDSLYLETRDGNNQRAAVGSTNINYGNSQHISFIHNMPSPSPLLNSSLPESPVLPVSLSRPHDMIIQSDGNKLQSHSSGQIASLEKDHTFFNLRGGMILEQRSHPLSGNSLQKLFSSHSDSLESFRVLQHGMVNQDFGHYGIEDGRRRTHIKDFSNFGSASDFKQNGQNLDVVWPRDISNAGIASSKASASSVLHKLDESRQYPREEECGRYSWDTVLNFNVNGEANQPCSVTSQMSIAEKSSRENMCLEGGEVNREDQGSTNTVISVSKIPCESSLDIANRHLVNKNLPVAIDSATKKLLEHRDDPSFSSKFDGKGALNNEKVASKVIWDGLLQLNASTTVSTVAFFKSGEKSLEVDWSKLIEVKGKVKLEAFEKYIQELPRSRNRALMVLSLCWKVSSSKNGLTGMKEVAKGYSKGEKVGFAQPAPGIDLYVCPHNDTIITILAKHGFFKGMTAVEGNRDSLIGCVVWRKNRTSSNSVSKSSEKMKLLMSDQQLDFPSHSTLLRAMEISSPLATTPSQVENCAMPSMIQPAQTSSTLVSVSDTRSSSLVSKSMSSKIKDTQASNDPVKGDNFHVTDVSPEITPFVSDNFPVISTAPTTVQKPDSFLHQPMKRVLKSEIPNINTAEPKTLDAGLKLLETVLTGSSRILAAPQQRSISPEEDDLPEFDFSTACGLSQCPESKLQSLGTKSCCSDAPQPCKQNTIEGLRNSAEPIPPAPPMLRPMAIISDQKKTCKTTFTGLPTDDCQGVPLPRKQGESDSQPPMLPIAEEKLVTLGGQVSSKPAIVKPENIVAAVQGTNSHIPHKKLWDDDDDMPEWCPPDLEHRTQLLTEATGLSNLSHFLQSASENVPPPPLLAPNSMSVNPPLPPGFPPGSNLGSLGQHPGTTVMMPQQTRPIAEFSHLSPSNSLGFNPRPLRLQHHPFDNKLPFKPVDWRPRKP